MEKKPFYITTPIYYPSGNPHIGHCYTTVACDSIARYRRMQGYDVMFLTGTDEHGLKIEQKAAEKGVTPKEYVDEIVKTFKKLWSYMNISYDRYIRTTDDYHIETVQKIFKALYDKGYIYKGEYKGKYCTPCESFWTESQLDENGCCPECHREVTEAKEEAYFFKMSPFAERIEKLLTETDYLQPKTRATELVNNFIKPGLEDLCVSRTTFKWGIPVTFDDKHVVYVWIDALSNYISALGFWNEQYNDFDKFWPADVHMVAKDIMRFHAIIWPAMLMALDLPLPKHLAVHGWITFNGQKMSKSLGNVVDPFILGERYGADAIRYHILREMALGADSSFSNEIMINRINSDLANGLGNLVSRTVAMADKYFGGTLPADREVGEFDAELIAEAEELRAKVDEFMDKTQINNALAEIFKVVSRANKYIDETAPWVLGKDESKKARLATVLYNLLETIRIVSTLLSNFMPTTMPKVWEQIGAAESDITYENAGKFGVLPADVTVHRGEIIFPRIDVDKEIEELNKIIGSNAEPEEKADDGFEPAPIADEITIDDFAKVDLRVALVKDCEKVKKSKKLLCLQLDDGFGGRQVVSGIAAWYKPEDLIGKKVVIVANLKPVKLCGVESNGMICAADTPDGAASVIFPDQDLPCGAKLR
ncbi:methionine--tRNA ligase [Ruminococcus sp. AF17-6LB]|uniref:methionine--tRNA ligase n=1 Tax=unclassified Ruminococcus TaxID=2608920 RepID=UPI000E4D122D|nr:MULTISPECIES: methionine--tRNA ligase [unclassified Ruminococcus]RGG72042.1 methionine--tRNA ligase [Ruminococcus sp. AF17-6LB]RGG73782.1 methionine--tRNA ligase [Ruminococcus sp. AF17-6]RGG73961.1 methionine--tRNA ligase [Ruminococcus sp. AF17-24]RGG80853.1 methionine--tRNA ligase [Ruminococcus sp. AF17-1AC]